ncbi:RlpA-like double-psi beta-barrel-protein domain-containing protein-containing protein [Phycomyces nitens]|nr:RlpA-like double-psi beta-barrel-protein domain-containing protein-containing protein [Phycomyces nitens]
MVRIISIVGFLVAFASTLTVAAPAPNTELVSNIAESVYSNHTSVLEKRKTTYKGTATWFIPETEGGVWGACGPKESSSSKIVALNKSQYGNMSKKSKWCGKKIRITGPTGKSVTATINDACPGCKSGDLDLTPVLFKQIIGNMNKGVGKIKWVEI